MGDRIWGVVNVKVNVKEGYRLQAAGYRELFVYLYGYVYENGKVTLDRIQKFFWWSNLR